MNDHLAAGMKFLRFPVLLALLFSPLNFRVIAAGVWDGEAGDGLFSSAQNWDDQVVPSSLFVNLSFPPSAPNKQVNLGGSGVAHERVVLQGGYRLFNGRIGVAGGGGNSEIESTGDNSLDADFGTFEWGNDIKLIQAAGGTLTVNGSSTDWVKSVILRGAGTFAINGTIAPLGGYAFYKEGTGLTRVAGQINGANSGRFVTQGTLLLNGSSDGAGPWNVNGGRIGGSGVLNSSLTVGSTLGSALNPGDPSAANGIGTFTANAGVTLGDHAVLEVELGNSGASDVLAVSGSLTLGPRTGLWVRSAAGATPSGAYTIVTHGGARNGTFVLLDAPDGARIDYSVAGQVRVVLDPPPAEENIVYPAGAQILDVTQPPYNAVPNDGLDDTVAIQAALDAFPNGRRIIYLPNGTYDISNTLSWPAGIPGWTDYKHTIMQGQSRSGSVLRLINNAPLFQNPSARRAVLFTGPGPAQRFGIMIRNLTVNTGSGNPGASGVQLNANNFGGIRQVKILSGDGQGVTGLDLHFTSEIGPLFVQDVEVTGFNHGVRTGDAINGIVLERVTVRGQNVAGIDNSGQVFSIRGFKSVNAVPALINGTNPFGGVDTGGVCTVLDAQLIGLPGAETFNAITTAAFLYARNVVSTGYARVLTRPTLAGNADFNGASFDEYQTNPTLSVFPSPSGSLRLPVEDAPAIPLDPLNQWANVQSFGAVGNGSTDDTAAFQAAVDSGAGTVYIPPTGFFIINGDLLLRGNVRRFTGTHANVGGGGRIILADGSAPAVIIERSGFPAILHQSARTLIVSSSEVAGITSTSPGKLFIEDVVTDKVDLQNPRQRVWARQLNTENGGHTNVINAGATLWILGYKTERGQVKIETRSGGFTELLGAHIFSTTEAKTTPLFTIDDASASFAAVGESNFEGTQYSQWVSEKRGATTNVLADSLLPFRTSANGRVMALFTGFDGAPKRPLDLAATATSPTAIALTWSDQSWDETAFQVERSADGIGWTLLGTPDGASYSDTSATPGATFFYRVSAVNATAASAASAVASATTPTRFQSWAALNGLDNTSGRESAFNADPERDGLANGLEWVLGGNPLAPGSAVLPQLGSDPSALSLSFARADESETSTTLVAQWSTTLVTWTDVPVGGTSSGPDANGVTVAVAENGTAADAITVRVPNTNAAAGRLFLRLKVTTP